MPVAIEAPDRKVVDTVRWAAPPFEALPSTRVGWVEDMISEGEGFLENQTFYKNLSQNLRIFDAVFRSDKTKSTLLTNKLKYNIRKFCETLAEVREIGTYGSDNPKFKQMAEMLTKVSKAVYIESDFPYQILKVLQYASVMGIGYLWPKVKAEDYGYGERKLVFEALGPLDVVPVQIPRSNDVQDCYAVTIYDYMPIAEAHGRFPTFQSQLITVGRHNYKNRMQARRQDYAEMYRYGEQGRSFGNLYCEIRYTFVRDLRINTTGHELPMGDPGTTWFYKVPSIEQNIFAGLRDNLPDFRPAAPEDCRVYPGLRLMITSSGIDKPLYDGPAFDWDPKIPIIQYTVDDWAWEPFGRSLVGDVGAIEVTRRKIERKLDQVITTTLNPPMGYNLQETGGPKIEHFDMFEEDVRLGVDGEPNKVMQSILPQEVRADAVHFQMLKYLDDAEQMQLGLLDLGNLANLKSANVSGDNMDKMLESIGPIAKGISARIEKGNKSVGNRMKFLILQWFTTARIMEYIGPDSLAPQIFDYNPDTLVPSHLPDEFMASGSYPTTSSMYSRLDRARWFARNLRLVATPNTLLRVTQMQEQLKYLQLKRGQAPISWATTMKKLDIPNYGEVEGATEREKFFNEEVDTLVMQIVAKAKAMAKLKELGIDPSVLMGQDDGGKGGGKGGKSGGNAGGRPPSGQKAPRIKQKGGGGGEPRTTVTES